MQPFSLYLLCILCKVGGWRVKKGNFAGKLMGKLRYLYPQVKSSKAIYCVVTILRFSTVGKGGFTGVLLWMSVSGLGWTKCCTWCCIWSNISSHWEWMDDTTEGELVNLPLMSSTHNVLLLCLGSVQLPQQLRCLTWALCWVFVLSEQLLGSQRNVQSLLQRRRIWNSVSLWSAARMYICATICLSV